MNEAYRNQTDLFATAGVSAYRWSSFDPDELRHADRGISRPRPVRKLAPWTVLPSRMICRYRRCLDHARILPDFPPLPVYTVPIVWYTDTNRSDR